MGSPEEAAEAREILAAIRAGYNVESSSPKGVAALRQRYNQLPEPLKAQIRTDVWQLKELQALSRALQHFAPLLGKRRGNSKNNQIPQQVISVSKLHESATENSPAGRLDGDKQEKTEGEYFPQARNFSLFAAGTNCTSSGFNNPQHLEATAVHELAHGLLGYRLIDFVKEVGYWTDAVDDPAAKAGEEPPITPYAGRNPGEDLTETVKYFFMKPDALQRQCPKRYEFMKKEVASWHASHE